MNISKIFNLLDTLLRNIKYTSNRQDLFFYSVGNNTQSSDIVQLNFTKLINIFHLHIIIKIIWQPNWFSF